MMHRKHGLALNVFLFYYGNAQYIYLPYTVLISQLPIPWNNCQSLVGLILFIKQLFGILEIPYILTWAHNDRAFIWAYHGVFWKHLWN